MDPVRASVRQPDRVVPDLRRLPPVPTAQELLDTAFGRGSKAPTPKAQPRHRARAGELARVSTAAKTLEARLNRIVRGFPSFDQLHPFYYELADVLVSVDRVRKSLGAVQWAHGQVQRLRVRAETELRRTSSAKDARDARRAAYGRMASVIEQVGSDLARLGEARSALRDLPILALDAPVLVVAGYPNVGKSSLLAHVSRATPEVATYPFTTKGVVLGHAETDRGTVQVMDTPGLLDRPLDERNDIERQAIQALRHAADAILFLLDTHGHCGYPIDEQRALLEQVRVDLEGTPIVVAANKADLGDTGEPLSMSLTTFEGVDTVLAAAMEATWNAFDERQGDTVSDEAGT